MEKSPNYVDKAKQKAFDIYMRGLDRLDPKVAHHLLGFQREMFLAGRAFFESEARHAEKAMAKFERKAREGRVEDLHE